MNLFTTIRQVAWLRWRLFMNRRRTSGAGLGVLGVTLLYGIGALFSLLVAFGLGAVVHLEIQGRRPEELDGSLFLIYALSLGAVYLFAWLVPLFLHGGIQGIEVDRLRLFPLKVNHLFVVVLGSSLAASEYLLVYPTLLALFVTGVLLPADDVPLGLALFAACIAVLVTWGSVLGLFLTDLMRDRRMRERAGLLLLVLVMTLCLWPILADSGQDNVDFDFGPLATVAEVLPPVLSARGLAAVAEGGEARALLSLFGLSLWVVAGLAVARILFGKQHRGEPSSRRSAVGSSSPLQRMLTPARRALRGPLVRLLGSQVVAVAEKDFAYLARSLLGRFVLVIMPPFVVLISFFLLRRANPQGFVLSGRELGFYGVLLYLPLTLNVYVNNAFSMEGSGVQSYFLMPIAPSRVVLGKNVALWGFASVLVFLCVAGWCLSVGFPSFSMLLTGLLLSASAVLTFTLVGNVTSIAFPAARRPEAMSNTLPGWSILLSVGALLAMAMQTAVCLYLPSLLGWTGFEFVAFGILFAVLVLVYRASLRPFGRWLQERSTEMIAAVRAPE